MNNVNQYIQEALRIKSGMKNISAKGEQKYLFEVYLYNRTGEEFLDLLDNLWGRRNHNVILHKQTSVGCYKMSCKTLESLLYVWSLIDLLFSPTNWKYKKGEYDLEDDDCAMYYINNPEYVELANKYSAVIDKNIQDVSSIYGDVYNKIILRK